VPRLRMGIAIVQKCVRVQKLKCSESSEFLWTKYLRCVTVRLAFRKITISIFHSYS